ncbi:MAG: hypothetical protein AB1714_17755 [Acidobacteriota bacterium]
MRDVAILLARMHVQSAPEITEIYLFPSGPAREEIRLIEIDPTTTPSEGITPYYFKPDLANGIPYVSAIALIRPEERKRLPLPRDWGSWQDAEKIWPTRSPRKHGD